MRPAPASYDLLQVQAGSPKLLPDLPVDGLPVGAGLVHLVDKDKGRDSVVVQQPPQDPHLAGDTIGGADDQDRVVQDLQDPLHLRRKIRVAGRIDQGPDPLRPLLILPASLFPSGCPCACRCGAGSLPGPGRDSGKGRKGRLLGKDRDPPVPLHDIGVQKGIPVIHPPRAADRAGPVQQGLRQGRLARVHMGQQAQA